MKSIFIIMAILQTPFIFLSWKGLVDPLIAQINVAAFILCGVLSILEGD